MAEKKVSTHSEVLISQPIRAKLRKAGEQLPDDLGIDKLSSKPIRSKKRPGNKEWDAALKDLEPSEKAAVSYAVNKTARLLGVSSSTVGDLRGKTLEELQRNAETDLDELRTEFTIDVLSRRRLK